MMVVGLVTTRLIDEIWQADVEQLVGAKVTVEPIMKPVPLMVTATPPATPLVDGLSEATVGTVAE